MLASTLKTWSSSRHLLSKAWRELYDVEMILRNIEGRRTIAASSFFLIEAALQQEDPTL